MTKIRDTASLYVDAPPRTVLATLRQADTISALGPRGTVRRAVGTDEVEVEGRFHGVDLHQRWRLEESEDRVDLSVVDHEGGSHHAWFIAREEGRGTRLVHGASLEPGNIFEEAVARLSLRELHRDLEDEVRHAKELAEMVDARDLKL